MASLYKRKESPFYWTRFTIGDRVYRLSTGEKNRSKAAERADEIEQEHHMLFAREHGLKLIEASQRFFTERRLRPKTVSNYETSCANIVRKLGNIPLKEVDKAQIKHYIDVRLRETGHVAIRRDLAFLSSLMSQAMNWENGPTENIVRTYDRSGLKEARERTTWLRKEDVEKLLTHARTPQMRLFIVLAVDTGMRWGELINLRWSEVDLDQGVIALGNLDERRTKTGESRIVVVNERALNTLRNTPRTVSGFVFESPKPKRLPNGTVVRVPMTTLKTSWRGLTKRAGMEGVRIHDLRHTFASQALQDGVSEIVIQAQLGHKTRSMTRRYAKPSLDTLLRAFRGFPGSTERSTHTTD